IDLGVNALELLPPADTFLDRRSWGYGTSNYFAPDFDLGRPLDPNATAAANAALAPTALSDLLALIRACHKHKIRFFYDAVMAFSRQDPYRFINFLDFHIQWGAGDPEQDGRDGFGGDLWKYVWNPSAYDPVSGGSGRAYLARRHMIAHVLHWMHFSISTVCGSTASTITTTGTLRERCEARAALPGPSAGPSRITRGVAMTGSWWLEKNYRY